MVSFSIITPTYNRVHLLEHTIASVLQQTFRAFEWLIIDDGSTDHTTELIQSVKDERIKFLSVPHSGYLSRVRNVGLKQAGGDLIAFMDSDDLWHPQKLEWQYAQFKQYPEADLMITGYRTFNAEGPLKESDYAHLRNSNSDYSLTDIFSPLIEGRMVVYPSTFVSRKNVVDAVGLMDETLVVADIEYILRLAENRVAIIAHKPLVEIRKHEQNISDQIALECFEESILVIDKYFQLGKVDEAIYQSKRAHYESWRQCCLRERENKQTGIATDQEEIL